MSEAPSVTVKELDEMVTSLFALKAEIEADEEKVSEKQKRLGALKEKIVVTLKEHEREDYKHKSGTVSISEKWRVSLPENDIEKEKLLAHLKERGIYTKYVTVNSNALNSLFLADWDEAKKNGKGMEFEMPGIKPPTLYEALSLRKGKGT